MHKSVFFFTRLSNAKSIFHAVVTSIIALLLLGVAFALTGWNHVGYLIVGASVLIAFRTILVVNWSLNELHDHTRMSEENAKAAEQHYISVLQRITRYAEFREGRDVGRSERVGNLCEEIASRLALTPSQCYLMNLAGQLHDIGLLTVPEYILKKSSQLNGNEFVSVKKHAEASNEILKPLRLLEDVLDGIKHHHERCNGTGYPDGLKGDDLSLSARILAVCDVYEAMTHDRPHRQGITSFATIEELRRCCPDGFDADIVEILAEIKHAPASEKEQASKALEPSPVNA